MRMILKGCVLLIFLLCFSGVVSQDDAETTPVITAQNVRQLQSVQVIDFEPLELFNTGWFALSADGEFMAAIFKDGGMNIYDTVGDVAYTFAFNTVKPVVEADFGADVGILAALHVQDLTDYLLSYHDMAASGFEVFTLRTERFAPASLWLTCDDTCTAWVEMNPLSGGGAMVARLPLGSLPVGEAVLLDDYAEVPYGPATDPEAVVRIGRIAPPVAVTSSNDGVVKRWNLETGEVTSEIQVENGPPVFGQINAAGTHLAWRDPASERLYVLSFETGKNQFVAELSGDYVQYFLLSNSADVIFAVNIEDEPLLVAWIVETGERIDLGEYRACGRTPDMARLSADGTTIVIGCDLGLEVWRVDG